MVIPTKATVQGIWRRGTCGVPRRCFPVVEQWGATFELALLLDTIPTTVVEEYLTYGGIIHGLGSFRPQHGGMSGRFEVVDISWKEQTF